MSDEQLFVETIDDLDSRLQLGRGEYDALCMAWLLRKLLLNGRRSLLSHVLQAHPRDVVVVIHDMGEVPTRLGGWIPLRPIDGTPSRTLSVEEFLKYPAIGIPWAGEDGLLVPVGDLIAYLANVAGAVHISRPTEGWQQALWDMGRASWYSGPYGTYSIGIFCLIEIGRVIRTTLEPIRAELAPQIPPDRRGDTFGGRLAPGPWIPELKADASLLE